MKNIHPIDRWLRLAVAILLVQAAFFWLPWPWHWLACAVAMMLVCTAMMRYCSMYRIMGMRSSQRAVQEISPRWHWLGWAALLALFVAGIYGSAFFSRHLFLGEFNAMNHFYKQTLFLTGKNEREPAVANWEKMVSSYAVFQRKYSADRPYALKDDRQLVADLHQVAQIMAMAEPLVRDGDLQQAHLGLEKIRPVF